VLKGTEYIYLVFGNALHTNLKGTEYIYLVFGIALHIKNSSVPFFAVKQQYEKKGDKWLRKK
jgi:hypothetical protein